MVNGEPALQIQTLITNRIGGTGKHPREKSSATMN